MNHVSETCQPAYSSPQEAALITAALQNIIRNLQIYGIEDLRTIPQISLENELLKCYCLKPGSAPRTTAHALQSQGIEIRMYGVLNILRDFGLNIVEDRNNAFQWAKNICSLFDKAFCGDKQSAEKIQDLADEIVIDHPRWPAVSRRIIVLLYFLTHSNCVSSDSMAIVMKSGDTWMNKIFNEMLAQAEKKQTFETVSRPLSTEEKLEASEAENAALRSQLEQQRLLMQDLQNEFQAELQQACEQEKTSFFSRLNSEKHGSILDCLLEIRKGLLLLQKKHGSVPQEINGVPALINQMIGFVKDSHIDPILTTGTLMQVKASDIEFYDYQGSPFLSEEEEKVVCVVSPGWIYRDKSLQISPPRVSEYTPREKQQNPARKKSRKSKQS